MIWLGMHHLAAVHELHAGLVASAEHHHALVCELEIHALSVNQPVAGRNVR